MHPSPLNPAYEPSPDATPAESSNRARSTDVERDPARAELRELRTQLDRALAELRQARRDAEAATAANERFLSSVSHDLRTPLSAILLWTTLIEEENLYEPQHLREAVEVIKRSAEEQQALIENLITTSRIVAGRFRVDRRPGEIAAILHAAAETVRPAAVLKNLALIEVADPTSADAPVDRERLQQAITHLLHNAVRFTPAGGRIQLSTRCTPAELQIVISDTGAGIAAERLPRILAGPDEATSKAPRTEAGLGYGLLVARRIVEAHGGILEAESAGINRGATFTIRLPRNVTHSVLPQVSAILPEARPVLADRHVLLVVDDPNARRTLAAALGGAGANVVAVDSAPAGWENCERRRPDVIVCDLALPTIDAATFLRRLRDTDKESGASAVPAVALASGASDTTAAGAIDMGFDCFITEPINLHHLITVVADCLPPNPRDGA